MRFLRLAQPVCLGLAVGVGLMACQGCAALRAAWVYTGDRVADGADMLDLGITMSGKRSFSLYACGAGLFTVGGGYMDGYFAGIGGSRVGVFRHYQKTIGLVLYSHEEFAWGKFDIHDASTLDRRHKGVVGWLFFPSAEGECRGPT